ncbi:uncharacterized protein LOC103982336 [Musa acuminata AAA Group]|uniref:uncharacterized protein LOC103982336 n=1 Tax=Musa acuminata AAA Group TaxID=214697 RepID=UPI0031E32DC7
MLAFGRSIIVSLFSRCRLGILVRRFGHGEIAGGAVPQDLPPVEPYISRCCSPRKWRVLASDDALWSNLFKERWGGDCAAFYAPVDPKSWKDVYIVQHRCDRFGLGLRIITEAPLQGIEEHHSGIPDRILFFLGDLEAACAAAKRLQT